MKASEQPNQVNAKEKRQIDQIEAALYASGRPLDLETLSLIVNVKSHATVKHLTELLVSKYKQANGALELLKLQDGRYVIQLRPDLAQAVSKLVSKKLMTRGPLKTLSFIAIKQPVTQAYVVKVRGNLAYGHIRDLLDKGLLSEERLGRTKVLRTTTAFADYFNLSSEPRVMKQQLDKIFQQLQAKDKRQTSSNPQG